MPYVTNITSSEYPVKTVTIFKTTAVGSLFGGQPSSAEIVRSFPVELKPGENIVKVHGLSSVIDTESARVSGLPDGVSLFDIVCKHTPPKPLEPDSVEEEIRVLNTRKETLNSEKRVRGHEADILVNYGKSLSGEHASPEIAATFLNTFISNGKQNIEAIAKIDEELVQIDRKIAQIREQQKEKVGHARAEVSVTLAARKDVSFEMKLTYRTRHVSWTANYDLHATTEAGQPTASVNLHYRAKIHQSTGEDWKDTTLTLSTASADSYSKGLPTLKPLRITPVFNAPHKAYYNPNNHPGGSAANTGAPAPFSYQARPANAIQMQVAPPPGGGFTTTLFGSQQMAQQSSSGGLFGSAAAQSSTIPPPVPPSAPTVAGGSLFGSSSAAAQGSAPATTGFGGFGGSATTTQGSARAAGLFGGHRANSSSQEPPSASDDEFEEIAPDSETLPEDRGDGDAQLDERKTIVQESALSTSFRVEGKVSVPSDGLPHQVLVAVIPFEAALTYVAIPRAEAAAYVQCEVKNTSEYRLLPGPVSVFLDESFVSKTSVQEVNTGDTFECTLGTDPLIGVTYSRSVRSGKVEGGSFSEKTRTVYYTTIAAIKNRHRFALPRVVVRDSIPLSGRPNALADEDNDDTSGVDRLRVILRKPLGLADAKDGEDVKLNASGAEDVVVRWMKKDANGNGGEKQGKFEWVAKVETGARVELRLEYEIKGGAETKWALRTTEK